jgi:pentose-5-phosphate-3-epimerase
MIFQCACSAIQALTDMVDPAVLVDGAVEFRRARLAARQGTDHLVHGWYKFRGELEGNGDGDVRPPGPFDCII